MSENGNKTYQNLKDIAALALRGKFIAISASIKKKDSNKQLTSTLHRTRKKSNPKSLEGKNNKSQRTKNDIKIKRLQSNETKSCFLKNKQILSKLD